MSKKVPKDAFGLPSTFTSDKTFGLVRDWNPRTLPQGQEIRVNH